MKSLFVYVASGLDVPVKINGNKIFTMSNNDDARFLIWRSRRSSNIFWLKVLQPLSPQAVESSNLQDIRLTGIGRDP